MNISCPKCGSTQFHSNKKGYSLKKGALGWFVTGGIGLIAGLIGGNKVVITCLSCGHSFKPGEGDVLNNDNQQPYLFKSADKDADIIKEHHEVIELNQNIKNKGIKRKKVICSKCYGFNEPHFRFCRVCGVKIDVSKMEIVNNGQNFEYVKCSKCYQKTPKPSKKSKFCINCGEKLN